GVVDGGSLGATPTFNLASGNLHIGTLTANATVTFSNPVAGAIYKFVLTQDGTGSRTVTWPAEVKWEGGVAPTLTTEAAATDIITCTYIGTTYYCSAQLDF